MIIKMKMCTTGKILVEMFVPEIETSNVWRIFGKNLGISKIWVYNKTCYFYIYTWDVSWIYKHKDQQVNISYSPSATFIPLLFYQLLPFFGGKCTLVHFLKNKQKSNSHTFCKVGKIQLWFIKTTCFTYLLLILIPQYENTFRYSTRGYMIQKNRIGSRMF